MSEAFASGLVIPAMFLALLAWLVPKLLSMVMPEGVKALIALTIFAAMLLTLISAVMFLALYVWMGAPWREITGFGVLSTVAFFVKASWPAAIIWAPIMIVSVAGLPRTWVKEVW